MLIGKIYNSTWWMLLVNPLFRRSDGCHLTVIDENDSIHGIQHKLHKVVNVAMNGLLYVCWSKSMARVMMLRMWEPINQLDVEEMR